MDATTTKDLKIRIEENDKHLKPSLIPRKRLPSGNIEDFREKKKLRVGPTITDGPEERRMMIYNCNHAKVCTRSVRKAEKWDYRDPMASLPVPHDKKTTTSILDIEGEDMVMAWKMFSNLASPSLSVLKELAPYSCFEDVFVILACRQKGNHTSICFVPASLSTTVRQAKKPLRKSVYSGRSVQIYPTADKDAFVELSEWMKKTVLSETCNKDNNVWVTVMHTQKENKIFEDVGRALPLKLQSFCKLLLCVSKQYHSHIVKKGIITCSA